MSRERLRAAGFAAYVAATLAYLAWRGVFTLNPEAPVYSTVFLALESYAALCSIAFYAIVIVRRPRAAPPPAGHFTVDVLVCSYNEPLSLVRQTLRRALAMHQAHRTFLLDDGHRPEARALCAELGCGYITRDENLDYKAGNLNNALSHSQGDLVVVLDADHLVRPEFLTRLVGYFQDPRVALVQTPQVFYNIDSFQHHFRARARRLWHEGAIFHHAMQPGADRWNAAFFVGTGAILRRSALEKIGGFALGSVTEDALTCMRLHAAGFQSVYHDEPLAHLLAPESLHQYLTQRLRWGQGSMQILRMENPLTRPGLSWRQRLVYFAALSSFAQALVHLAYYTAPAMFLLGGPAPLRAAHAVDFAPLVAHIVVDLVVFKLYLGALARPILAECFKFLNVYAYLKALTAYFHKGRLQFKVTNKGRDAGASLGLLAPQLALLLLNCTAFGYGVLRLVSAGSLVERVGVLLATFFAGLFVVVGAMAALFARDRLAARRDTSFPDEIPARLWDGARATDATVVRASESELRILLPAGAAEPPRGARIEAELALGAGGELRVSGEVRETAPARLADGTRASVLRVELEPLGAAARDQLFDRFALVAMPRVVDPLVRIWSGESAAGAVAALPAYYLPVEPDVL